MKQKGGLMIRGGINHISASTIARTRQVRADVKENKINAKIEILENEMKKRIFEFGVEVYDHIEVASKDKSRSNVWSTLCHDKICSYAELSEDIRAPYDNARKEMSVLIAEKKALMDESKMFNMKLNNINNIMNLTSTTTSSSSSSSKLSPSSSKLKGSVANVFSRFRKKVIVKNKNAVVSDVVLGTKQKTELKKIDEQMYAIKQQFGIMMFAVLKYSERRAGCSERHWKNRDRKIKQCYEHAKQDIKEIFVQKGMLEKEMQEALRAEF